MMHPAHSRIHPLQAPPLQRSGKVYPKGDYGEKLDKKRDEDENIPRFEQHFDVKKAIPGYSPTAPFLVSVQQALKFLNRLPGVMRSVVMGSLRGMKINHKQALPWLPSVQGHLNKIKNVTRTDTLYAPDGEKIEVPFVEYRIKQPKSEDGRFHLALFGDPGYANSTLEYMVSACNHFSESNKKPLDAVLLTGDLLYASNERSSKHALFKEGDPKLLYNNIFQPYRSFFREKIPVFSPLGNNDIEMGQGDTLLNYLNQPPFYKITLGEGDDAVAEIFIIDETVLAPLDFKKLDKKYHTTYYTRFANHRTQAQQHWLREALKESKAEHPDRPRILLKHFPANGVHQSYRDKPYMLSRLCSMGDLFEQFDGIMTGHVHGYYNVDLQEMVDPRQVAYKDIPGLGLEQLEDHEMVQPIPQQTLGSSSHFETPETPDNIVYSEMFSDAAERDKRYMPKSRLNLAASNTGFLWIEGIPASRSDDHKPHLKSYMMHPPMTNKSMFQAGLIHPGEAILDVNDVTYHPDSFKVLDVVDFKHLEED